MGKTSHEYGEEGWLESSEIGRQTILFKRDRMGRLKEKVVRSIVGGVPTLTVWAKYEYSNSQAVLKSKQRRASFHGVTSNKWVTTEYGNHDQQGRPRTVTVRIPRASRCSARTAKERPLHERNSEYRWRDSQLASFGRR